VRGISRRSDALEFSDAVTGFLGAVGANLAAPQRILSNMPINTDADRDC
jgi:hypothetical protein